MVYTLFKNRTSEPEYDGTQRQRGGPPKQYRFVLFRGCAQGRKTRARSLSCARQKIRFYIYNSKALLYLWCTQTCFVARYYLWLCRAFIKLGGGLVVYVTALFYCLGALEELMVVANESQETECWANNSATTTTMRNFKWRICSLYCRAMLAQRLFRCIWRIHLFFAFPPEIYNFPLEENATLPGIIISERWRWKI